jgi:hypothetical protein
MRKTRTRLLAAAGSMLAAGAIAVSGIVAAAAAPHTARPCPPIPRGPKPR